MSREGAWLQKRLGMITASEVSQIMSAKGGIIETNLSYIRAKRWERKRGFSHPVYARPMEIGNQQEPMIQQWALANLGFSEIVYSKDLPEIPFWIAPDCPLGASPDAYTPDERVTFEYKTLVGATAIEYFGDEYTSYQEKRIAVWKDHGDQILAQWLSNPKVEMTYLIKYIYQDDDIMADTDSPLAPWRGVVFPFERKDYSVSLEELAARIRLFDAMIDSTINPSDFKKGEWFIDATGQLCKK